MTPYPEKNKSGKMVWRIAYFVAGKRVRKTFASEDQSRRWMKRRHSTADLEGRRFANQWMAITNKEKHEILESLKLVRKLRESDPTASLVEAAKAYGERRTTILKSVTLKDAIAGFLAFKRKASRKGNVSDGWLKVLETCLNKVHREIADNCRTLPRRSRNEGSLSKQPMASQVQRLGASYGKAYSSSQSYFARSAEYADARFRVARWQTSPSNGPQVEENGIYLGVSLGWVPNPNLSSHNLSASTTA